MRIAAVGDIHGRENLGAVASDLDRLGPVDLFLLAGDTTDRNDLEAYDAVLRGWSRGAGRRQPGVPRPTDLVAEEAYAAPRGRVPATGRDLRRPPGGGRSPDPPDPLSADLRHDGRREGGMASRTRM